MFDALEAELDAHIARGLGRKDDEYDGWVVPELAAIYHDGWFLENLVLQPPSCPTLAAGWPPQEDLAAVEEWMDSVHGRGVQWRVRPLERHHYN